MSSVKFGKLKVFLQDDFCQWVICKVKQFCMMLLMLFKTSMNLNYSVLNTSVFILFLNSSLQQQSCFRLTWGFGSQELCTLSVLSDDPVQCWLQNCMLTSGIIWLLVVQHLSCCYDFLQVQQIQDLTCFAVQTNKTEGFVCSFGRSISKIVNISLLCIQMTYGV